MSAAADSPVYLDHAATTPVRPEVREAIAPYLGSEGFGHPSSMHRRGQRARAAIEAARRTVAAVLGVEPSAVLFTSGGTEADNLAVIGAALAARSAGRPFRVAVSSIEHKAVLEAARAVEEWGGEAVILPVDATGHVELDAVEEALTRGVALVSVMWVNNEMGALQDVSELAGRCAARGTLFHSDAVQAFGKVPIDLRHLPNPMISLSGHKIGAVPGVGVLIVHEGQPVTPLMYGGGQQRGLRAGTENAAAAVAMARAVELAALEQAHAADRTNALREALEAQVLGAIPDASVIGSGGRRAPHITAIAVPGTDSESLLMQLDLAGVACSSGSACNTGSLTPSHVLTAMGVDPALAVGALRFSFSLHNSERDVARAVAALPAVVAKTRELTETLNRR